MAKRSLKNRGQRKSPRIAEPLSIDRLVSPEARAKGIYDFDRVEMEPGRNYIDKDGEQRRSNPTMQLVVRNKGGTTVDRWVALGSIDERQKLAIRRYVWVHDIVVGGIPAKSGWPELSGVTGRGAGMTSEARLIREDEARCDWDIMQSRVFRGLHKQYDCWQNVVLHDEPAGISGGRLGFAAGPGAKAAALTTVRFFADLIAGEFGIIPENDNGRIRMG